MKKLFAIVLTIFALVSVLCLTAVAAEPSADTMIRVRAQEKDGDVVEIADGDYKNFADGWNKAADLAQDLDWMEENGFVRIVVDLYGNWKANEKGKFGSGKGFSSSTIWIPDGAHITINMNGHTIDRGLASEKRDGEVIFMGEKSNLIINGGKEGDEIVKAGQEPGAIKMGKITGGNSYNGAGGIHMEGYGTLVLNNVNLEKNRVEDDDGAAIAAYNNSVVIINGGSITKSTVHTTSSIFLNPYGAIYLSNSEAKLTEVEFSDNVATGMHWAEGLLIYLRNSKAAMNNCLIKDNAYQPKDISSQIPLSLFHISDAASSLDVYACRFENNGDEERDLTSTPDRYYDIFHISEGKITVTDSVFENNKLNQIIGAYEGYFVVENCQFINNRARLFLMIAREGSYFGNCTFSGNHIKGKSGVYVKCAKHSGNIQFVNCDFIDNPIVEESYKKCIVIDSRVSNGTASIFGEGTLAMIIALLALVASGVSIFLTVYYNKKKAAPATVSNTAEKESEDEE